MITGEMVKEAIRTGHEVCKTNDEGCTHHAGIAAAANELAERAKQVIILTLTDTTTVPPEIGLVMEGIHIGYRLAQLEQSDANSASFAAARTS